MRLWPVRGRMWGFRMRLLLTLAFCLTGAMGMAEEGLPEGPALTAETFDALTRGKRMDTYDPNNLYGVEEFLSGQRSVWRDTQGCMSATWKQVGEQICFFYEDRPNDPDCWVYKEHKGAIWGWYNGQPDGSVVRLVPGDSPMTCDYIGV